MSLARGALTGAVRSALGAFCHRQWVIHLIAKVSDRAFKPIPRTGASATKVEQAGVFSALGVKKRATSRGWIVGCNPCRGGCTGRWAYTH